MKRIKEQFPKLPDVRSLDQRESRLKTRKGMKAKKGKIRPPYIQMSLFGDPWAAHEVKKDVLTADMLLPNCVDNPVEEDDMRPAYVKKYLTS